MTRAAMARDFFIELGYKPWQAAGIVGNLMQESGPGLDTGAEGDDGTAHGIAQWRDVKGGKRFTRLKEFAADQGTEWTDFQTQLQFVDYELKNHETEAYEALQASTDIPSATAAMISYERPQGWTPKNPQGGHGWEARLSNAMGLAGISKATGGIGSDTMASGKTLNQVIGSAGIGSDVVASKAPAEKSRPRLADMDFAGLFTPPEFPPLPELPPIPDPVPLQQEAIQTPNYQRQGSWSGFPGLPQAPGQLRQRQS